MFLLFWLALILALSVLPLSAPRTDVPSDKIIHFILYGLTAIFLFRFFIVRTKRRRALWISILSASAYGAFIEVIQSLIPHRTFSVGDLAANTCGAFLLVIIYATWRRR